MMDIQGWQSRNAATVENSVLKNSKECFILTHLFPNSNLIKLVKEELTKECYLLFSTSVFCDLVIFIIPATERNYPNSCNHLDKLISASQVLEMNKSEAGERSSLMFQIPI